MITNYIEQAIIKAEEDEANQKFNESINRYILSLKLAKKSKNEQLYISVNLRISSILLRTKKYQKAQEIAEKLHNNFTVNRINLI